MVSECYSAGFVLFAMVVCWVFGFIAGYLKSGEGETR